MILGFKTDSDGVKVGALIDEWNEVFQDPMHKLISDTEYYKGNDKLCLPKDTFIMSVKPMFPYIMWLSIFGLGGIAGIIFGWYTMSAVLFTILLFFTIFFIPYLYFLGTKSRLKRRGIKAKLTYLSSSEVLRLMIKEGYPNEN